MATKSPRFVRSYPRKKETGIRWFKRDTVDPEKLRLPRPRVHARSWKWRTRQDRQLELESRAANVQGSLQEKLVYAALVRWGLVPGVDFTFQPSMLGGRAELGGLVADFMLPLPMVIIQVQSYWHTITLYHEKRDEDQAAVLASMGYLVLELWPETIEDQAALDEWIERNVMHLWGTSSQGQSMGAVPGSFSYLNSIELDLMLKIERTVGAILEIV